MKTHLAYRGPALETFQIPIEHCRIVEQRIEPLIAASAVNGFDIRIMAMSCYQQGILDCVQLFERGHLKEIIEPKTDYQI